jgi:hypothetical protein
MKTEAEIRRHLENLKLARPLPCGCAESRHSIECAVGGRIMDAMLNQLEWVVGDNEALQPYVDHISASLDQVRREMTARVGT